MSIKLVVWDWNGTLLDDAQITVDAVNTAVLPLLNLSPVSLDEYREVFEVPIVNNYINMGVSKEEFLEKSEQISHAFHSHYEPLAAHAHLREGAQKLLVSLKESGISSIILSNHTLEGIYLQLGRLNISELFDEVLANGDKEQVHHSGKKHRLEAFLQDSDYSPHEVVIVGDTAEEVSIGSSLGLHTIAITGGFSSRTRLVATKPDHLISSLKQVLTILEELA